MATDVRHVLKQYSAQALAFYGPDKKEKNPYNLYVQNIVLFNI